MVTRGLRVWRRWIFGVGAGLMMVVVLGMRGLEGGGLGRELGREFDSGGSWREMMGGEGVLMGMRAFWLVYGVTAAVQMVEFEVDVEVRVPFAPAGEEWE